MLYNFIKKLDKKIHFSTVSAHCDIPCKIYDPIHAQLATLTMVRMVDLITDIQEKPKLSLNDQAQFLRLVSEKDNHGHKVKQEIAVIWGDFIKASQLEQFPEIHQLVHSIMLEASNAKQHINKIATLSLLEKVNRFSEIFWHCKGFETYTAKCPYPPQQNLIYPVLTS